MTDQLEPIGGSGSFLDENMGNVDTSRAVIKGPVTAEVEIVSVEETENKDKTGNNLTIKIKTVKELPAVKGDPIGAGFTMTTWISLVPQLGRPDKRDYTPDDIRKSLAQFLEAVLGDKNQTIKPLERFKGLRCLAKITVEEESKDGKYPMSNRFTFVKKA